MTHLYDFRKKHMQKLIGMEIFEITPVILGGCPNDKNNKTTLTREQHIEACKYWNNQILELKKKQDMS